VELVASAESGVSVVPAAAASGRIIRRTAAVRRTATVARPTGLAVPHADLSRIARLPPVNS
jgi:hypothetical protein